MYSVRETDTLSEFHDKCVTLNSSGEDVKNFGLYDKDLSQYKRE